LPIVISRDELARLIAAARNLKVQAALSIAYGAGLRASEVVSLKLGDIDSQRMTYGAMNKSDKLSPEVRERAVRTMQAHRGEQPSLLAAVQSIAPRTAACRRRCWACGNARRSTPGHAQAGGVTTAEAQRLKELENLEASYPFAPMCSTTALTLSTPTPAPVLSALSA
jgi:integrase